MQEQPIEYNINEEPSPQSPEWGSLFGVNRAERRANLAKSRHIAGRARAEQKLAADAAAKRAR